MFLQVLTWRGVIARRLARHFLLEPAQPGGMTEVVSTICGAHAQVAASTELMVGMRVRDITRQDVRAALWRDRTLVKTVGIRGTLHVFAAEEVPMWMAANRLLFAEGEKRLQRVGISPRDLHSAIEAIGTIVGSEPITRAELERRLEDRVGGWTTATNRGWMGTHKNWPMALGWAAALGLVCYGPGERGRSTFVSLREWSGWREVDPEDGGRFAIRKFLSAYGPSTAAEFGRWFGATPVITRRILGAASDELVEVSVEGEKRWAVASDASEGDAESGTAINLLPHFDAFVVGSHPRNRLISPTSPIASVIAGTAAPFAVVLRGGQVAGVWHRKPDGRRLAIRVDAYWKLNRSDRLAIEVQANRVAQILERECEVEFGPVALRPHA